MVLTPNFQNPTGTTMPEASRRAVLAMARRAGVVVVENDLYGELRYRGADIPVAQALDPSGDTILLGSFSKIAFPGLARRLGHRAAALHRAPDRSQGIERSAFGSAFAGGAAAVRGIRPLGGASRENAGERSRERLKPCLAACARELPPGSRFTRPEGGMNVWVRLPEPLDAAELAARAEREGVSFLPGPLLRGVASADARVCG